QVEQATTDAIGDPVEFACALVGLFAGGFAGGSVSVCEDARDACIANPSPDAQEGQFSCELGDPTARMDCDVTVGEARACFDDSLALLADNRDQFACAALASTEPATPLEDPASCAGLETRCPVLFGDD
ncbi:MAG TPA: hypothetical protein RMF84_08905, partial [Polyangiaceae bacterium LLY-WYZ-14_1]|nr:hypothetical protein [Polyangiaceae bacterium LLY-WYZ-14_1]